MERETNLQILNCPAYKTLLHISSSPHCSCRKPLRRRSKQLVEPFLARENPSVLAHNDIGVSSQKVVDQEKARRFVSPPSCSW